MSTNNHAGRGSLKKLPRVSHRLIFIGLAQVAQQLSPSFTIASYDAFVEWLAAERDPNCFATPMDYFNESQARALFKKNGGLRNMLKSYFHVSLADPKLAAHRTFHECEEKCRTTNQYFNEILSGKKTFPSSFAESVFFTAQWKIQQILAKVPDLENVPFSFGPGATTTVKRNTTAVAKLTAEPDVTLELRPWLNLIQGKLFPAWPLNDAIVSNYSQLSFVPKNYKTDRPIGVEPLVNSAVQRLIGNGLRIGLFRYTRGRVDLRTQDNNRRAARAAFGESLATIDLKSASDTISSGLVEYLLGSFSPIYRLMDVSRSHRYHDPITDSVNTFHKFSSMGNGFTFELETTIFLAIVEAVYEVRGVKSSALVYGDDIIVQSELAQDVIDMLEIAGFSTNQEKTFTQGKFFESCGFDFFEETFVRPVYFDHPNGDLIELVQTANNLLRVDLTKEGVFRKSANYPDWGNCVAICRASCTSHQYFVDLIPEELRFVGPIRDGDPWLYGPINEWSNNTRSRKDKRYGFADHRFSAFQRVGSTYKFESDRMSIPLYFAGRLHEKQITNGYEGRASRAKVKITTLRAAPLEKVLFVS